MGTIIRGVIKSRFTFRIGLILLAAAVSGCSSSALLAGLGSGLTSRNGSTEFKFGNLLQVAGGFEHNCYLIRGKVGGTTKTRVFCTGKGILIDQNIVTDLSSAYRLGIGLGFLSNPDIDLSDPGGNVRACDSNLYLCLISIVKSLPVVDGYGLPLEDVRSISAGKDHTCAVVGSVGKVYCWGDNQYAQLGGGGDLATALAQYTARVVVKSGSGSSAVLLTDAIQVAAGHTHTCAIVDEAGINEVYCWGSQSRGESGPLSGQSAACPLAANGSCLHNATKHTGLTISGYVNDSGSNPTPSGCSAAAGAYCPGIPTGLSVVKIRSGNQFSCALFEGTLNAFVRRVACWGDNSQNQIGANAPVSLSAGNTFATPAATQCGDTAITGQGNYASTLCSGGAVVVVTNDTYNASWYPPIDESENATNSLIDFDVGSDHSCLIYKTGSEDRVRCWGLAVKSSQYLLGHLGAGNIVSTDVVASIYLRNASTLTVGDGWACVLTKTNIANSDGFYCWGDQTAAVINGGAPTHVAVNRSLAGFSVSVGQSNSIPYDGWVNLFTQDSGDSSLALGKNDFGQLGLGDLINVTTMEFWSGF